MGNFINQFTLEPEEAFQDRIEGIKKWLQETDACKCQIEQLHTTEGTQERIYWHYGYMVALGDVISLLVSKRATQN